MTRDPALSLPLPRWASRLTLEVTEVRVERVQGISIDDIVAEGYPDAPEGEDWPDAGWGWFETLWDSLNGKRPGCAWADNPWVWAISFRRLP